MSLMALYFVIDRSLTRRCSMSQIFETPKGRVRLAKMAEAAEFFCCSRRHLERLIAAGTIQCVRVGRLVRLDLAAVEEQLKQHSSGRVLNGQDDTHA